MMNYKSKMVAYDFKNPVKAVFDETYTDIMTDELSREYGVDTDQTKRKIILHPYYVEWSYYQMFYNYAITRGVMIYEYDTGLEPSNIYFNLISLIISELFNIDKNYI